MYSKATLREWLPPMPATTPTPTHTSLPSLLSLPLPQACLEVSTHRHGCCVVQRCLDAATPPQRRAMVVEIGRNCLQLMQDPYGNYVVQYVLDRCPGDEIRPVTSCPLGRIASLSVQKYSSNVIEKCLEKG